MHIFFTYDRPCHDMEIAKECAQLHSPKSQVVALVSPDSDRAQQYRKLAKLIPTANPFNHEISCLLRWVHLLDFMETQKIETVLACDVDVLIFQDMEAESQGWLKDFDYTLGKTDGAHLQASISLMNIKVIQAFVDFLFSRNGVEINDMVAWTDFRLKHPQFRCGFYTDIRNDTTYDLSMGIELDRFASIQLFPHYRHKNMVFRNGVPFCSLLETGKDIRFKSLHCWAWSRKQMKTYLALSKATGFRAETGF